MFVYHVTIEPGGRDPDAGGAPSKKEVVVMSLISDLVRLAREIVALAKEVLGTFDRTATRPMGGKHFYRPRHMAPPTKDA